VSDWKDLSEDEQTARFHQEIAIMWSLSFHPNIIKLVGYTDSPRSIITLLYPTDLFRFLHVQVNNNEKKNNNNNKKKKFKRGTI
jgi:hypothetical protein